jgi:pyruvate/2-oxoglutarate/acetoin dehydrogenase E1 component
MKSKFPLSKLINLTLDRAMKDSKKVICFGLGATDPKGIFGTTLNLEKKFGSGRVFDVPASENALTGFAIGCSLNNKIPILVHQRLDFALLSIDQIFNGAAKWLYMSAGKKNVPLVIRLIIGRGWGQGPQHSQSLESIFAHIPGLKVVCPSDPFLKLQLMFCLAALIDKASNTSLMTSCTKNEVLLSGCSPISSFAISSKSFTKFTIRSTFLDAFFKKRTAVSGFSSAPSSNVST